MDKCGVGAIRALCSRNAGQSASGCVSLPANPTRTRVTKLNASEGKPGPVTTKKELQHRHDGGHTLDMAYVTLRGTAPRTRNVRRIRQELVHIGRLNKGAP